MLSKEKRKEPRSEIFSRVFDNDDDEYARTLFQGETGSRGWRPWWRVFAWNFSRSRWHASFSRLSIGWKLNSTWYIRNKWRHLAWQQLIDQRSRRWRRRRRRRRWWILAMKTRIVEENIQKRRLLNIYGNTWEVYRREKKVKIKSLSAVSMTNQFSTFLRLRYLPGEPDSSLRNIERFFQWISLNTQTRKARLDSATKKLKEWSSFGT